MVIGHCHWLMDFAVLWLWTFTRCYYLSFIYSINNISIYIGEKLPYTATIQVSDIDSESKCGWIIGKHLLSSRNSATLGCVWYCSSAPFTWIGLNCNSTRNLFWKECSHVFLVLYHLFFMKVRWWSDLLDLIIIISIQLYDTGAMAVLGVGRGFIF